MSNPIVSVDEESLRNDIVELVRKTVQDTLNALLDQEADEMVGAERYERTADREAYRSGHYRRKLVTTSGVVELDVPKLRGATFQTAVIERYRRRETSVEEAIIEMYLAGVSTRRIEDVSEILWGAGVSAGTVSNLNEKAYKTVEEWRGSRCPASTPTSSSTAYTSSAAGAAPTRTSASSWPSASTATGAARSLAAPRGSPSRRTRGRSSCCG